LHGVNAPQYGQPPYRKKTEMMTSADNYSITVSLIIIFMILNNSFETNKYCEVYKGPETCMVGTYGKNALRENNKENNLLEAIIVQF
jgi:hypothetical protein